MRGHLAPRALGALGADLLVDPAVGLGGVAQAEALQADAPGLPDDLGERPDDRGQDRVSGAGGHRAVEGQVVTQEGLGLLQGREHGGDLVGHARELLAGGALRGEAGGSHLEHPPRLVHLLEREAM